VFNRIDHVGIAVDDLDAAIALYQQSFGMKLVHRETVTEQ
jgi:methylmalonyl-CoA/ethylmalonyl-CoA epimerase